MKKVIVYSTPTCPYCTMAKDYLKKKKVEFKEIDVSKDDKTREEMIEKSGRMGVPQIFIGDNMVIGFNVEAIDNAWRYWTSYHRTGWFC